jgi:hypothetical protein
MYAIAEQQVIEQAKRIRELEAENARLNMEMFAYREKLTPADAAALVAVMNSLYAEKKWREAQHWGPCGNPPHVKRGYV